MTFDLTIHKTHSLIQIAMFQAAKSGNIKLVRELIKAGANLFEQDITERNALSYAMAANLGDTVKLVAELYPITEYPQKIRRTDTLKTVKSGQAPTSSVT